MLDLNVTFVIQLFNLVITLILVNHLLVRPVRDIIARRKIGRDDLTRQIDSFVSRAEQDAERYDKTLRAAREEGSAMRRKAREDALARQQEVLAASGAEASEFVRRERERSRVDSEQANAALATQVDELAADVVRKLLA